jgi:nucleoredoxin
MASWAAALFGDVLVSKDGAAHDTKTALANKTVGIYFSARWCPPCRQFTPAFAETFVRMTETEKKAFQVVFVSSDEDESAFEEYLGEMPWLALPFKERELKAKLASRFKVRGIPTLVIVDESGNVVAKDGRSAVTRPEAFPWTPPSLAEVLGSRFVRNDQERSSAHLSEITESAGVPGTNLGVYFSAHWCGPCRQFTPKLKELYVKLRSLGKPFEVLFVSSDRDQSEFDAYLRESMPSWLTVPFADAARRQALSEHFEVQGIPRFVMLGPDLKVINPDARGAALADPDGARFPWLPPLVVDVDSEDMDGSVNDTPTLIVLMEESGDRWDALNASLTAVAEKIRAREKDAGLERRGVRFATATETGGVGGQVRKLARLGKPKANAPQMVLLDLANGGFVVFEGEINQGTIQTSVESFLEGELSLTEA